MGKGRLTYPWPNVTSAAVPCPQVHPAARVSTVSTHTLICTPTRTALAQLTTKLTQAQNSAFTGSYINRSSTDALVLLFLSRWSGLNSTLTHTQTHTHAYAHAHISPGAGLRHAVYLVPSPRYLSLPVAGTWTFKPWVFHGPTPVAGAQSSVPACWLVHLEVHECSHILRIDRASTQKRGRTRI